MGGGATGERLRDALPRLAAVLETGTPVPEIDRDGTTRCYRVSGIPFAAGRTRPGRLLVFTDVTIPVGSLEDGFYVADDGPGIRAVTWPPSPGGS